MNELNYDVAVIGTGSAGSTVAYKVNSAGKKVVVIDEFEIGGTCQLRGCNPKKVLTGAAGAVKTAENLYGKGIEGDIKINWGELVKFEKSFLEGAPEANESAYENKGIKVIKAHAEFEDKNIIKAGNNRIKAENIVIASGSKPMRLNIMGEEYMKTGDDFMKMDKMPDKIVFAGGGYIAFELAHIASAAGADVTILEAGSEVLRGFDSGIVGAVKKASEEAGIKINVNSAVHKIAPDKDSGYIVHAGDNGSKKYSCGLVIKAAGRVPNTGGLKFDRAGISSENGKIKVNEFMQAEENENVYFGGDADNKGAYLTPVAGMEGTVIANNILKKEKEKSDYTGVPSAVFTYPPAAGAGLTEKEAQDKKINYTVKKGDMSKWMSYRRMNQKYGFYKVVFEKETGKIIGAHLMGLNAEEVINVFAMAIRLGLTRKELKKMVWAFPTNTYDINYMV